MPFPVDKKYIEITENELNVIFPDSFKNKMTIENGGELSTDEDAWQLFPFFDQSDSKRISRTCNHIGLETKQAKEWENFPKTAIAIASNGCGDLLVLLPQDNSLKLQDKIFLWYHETGDLEEIAEDINSVE